MMDLSNTVNYETWKSWGISMGKIAYCFMCKRFLTNMQDLDTCPYCGKQELEFST